MPFLSVVILVAATLQPISPQPADLRTSDLAVYRVVLDSVFVSSAPSNIKQLVLFDSTETSDGKDVAVYLSDFSRLPVIDTAAVRDFATRSREAHALTGLARLGLRLPIVFVDRQALRSFPHDDPYKYWSQFYRRYPGSSGHIHLSAVGYGANGDLAILMVDQGCGSLCGNGYVVAVRRVAGTWRIAGIRQTWVS